MDALKIEETKIMKLLSIWIYKEQLQLLQGIHSGKCSIDNIRQSSGYGSKTQIALENN